MKNKTYFCVFLLFFWSSIMTAQSLGQVNTSVTTKRKTIEVKEKKPFTFPHWQIGLDTGFNTDERVPLYVNAGYRFDFGLYAGLQAGASFLISGIPVAVPIQGDLRYYFGKNNFQPYLRASFGPCIQLPAALISTTLNAGVGISIRLSSHFSLEAEALFDYTGTLKYTYTYNTETFVSERGAPYISYRPGALAIIGVTYHFL